MYYGQFDTDEVIEKLFPKGYIGNCVEVGAYDGIKGSNTLFFEDSGWNCLCVEPIHKQYLKCKQNRIHAVNFACDCYIGLDSFTVFDIGESHINSSLSSLRTDPRLLESHSNLINKIEIEKVHVDTLTNILYRQKWPKNIDFVSIDTEGTELNVLRGIDFDVFKIKFLVVENNFDDKDITDYLKDFKYKKIDRYRINDFYELQA